MLTIINYNSGNIFSIQNMLKKIGYETVISSDPEDVLAADKLILPGVGAFDHGILNLNELKLIDVIRQRVLQGVPLLGICLGAQMLGKSSQEGHLPGLSLIDMDVVKFKQEQLPIGYKIPHMGWSEVYLKKPSILFSDMYPEPRFYFVHSYHFSMHHDEDILTTSTYGYEFTSAFQWNNIMGVQFHPEKSHKYGMQLLSEFVKL